MTMPPSLPSDLDELADGDNASDYERIWSLLQKSDDERAASFDVDEEWDRLADRLDLSSAAETETRRAPDRPPTAQHAKRRWTHPLTATLLVLMLVGIGGWWWSQPVTVTTTPGEKTTVGLPDGSTVELNGATTLTYPRRLSSILGDAPPRRVTLNGEAFFSIVARNRPFRVHTANAQIEVLGTTFNVRTQPGRQTSETTVTVQTGRVQVTGTDASSGTGAVVLDAPGEMSHVRGRNAPVAPRPIDLKYVQAWRQGGFAMAKASLPDVLRELERRFGSSLTLSVPPAATDTMTLHYARDARLTNVLRDICLIQDLSYRKTSRGYELVRDSK